MRQEIITFAFVAAMFLLLTWRVRGGYACGMMQEIVNILSGAVSLVCVALVFLAVSSAVNRSMNILTACIVGLILLGVCFKICSLLFKPLLAVGNISVLNGINKLLGAIMGAAEACLLAYIFYRLLGHFGIYVF